ncbi:hypothetical protein K503DRAFT_636313 [Rhizopogon vinicolor AM-OR11-026]|uniref:Uncharacterized protein n=1 Tax=Rhizopogon vinicolor AM-OR11-026 TaxID=1314800 RepID=A0A1B7N5W3_9AGAM|nr:hypothetical protein K503DRAFT_636313 [Rhizopogon vinicolor AM-OR11-026]
MNLSPPRRMVDKCTPRDKYARTHVHLKSSFLQSSDDSNVTTLTSPWIHSYNSRQRSQSSADTQGWKHLPTPIRPTFRPRDGHASPLTPNDVSSAHTNTFKVLQRSLNNLDFDPTCLDRLDDQLLLSPTESFVDVCYSEAIHEDVPVPILQPIRPRIRNSTRLYDRTAGGDDDPFHDWDENYSVKFKKPRQKRVVTPSPLPDLPESSTPRTSQQDSMLALLESSFLYHNPNESVHFFPVPTQRRSGESRKSSLEAPSVSSTGSSGKFRRISDALTGRSRTKFPA